MRESNMSGFCQNGSQIEPETKDLAPLSFVVSSI